MDLRRRLLIRLGVLLAGLIGVTLLVQWHSLRADIAAEIAASSRLVDVLLAANAGDGERSRQLASHGLRHLHIRHVSEAGEAPQGMPAIAGEQEIRIGKQRLLVSTNPASEIDERRDDTVQLLITLLFYSGATLLVAWWVTDRALRPVRELEAGLARLADGNPDPALPAFALREFSRVGQAIERLAGALAEARASQQALARQLIRLQEDERRTLARELHDDMGQTLTALNATAAHLERNAPALDAATVAECAADLRRDLRHGSEQLRALLKSLRPHGLNAAGLRSMLRELVEGWRQRETGIEFAMELPASLPEVDEEIALTLYRVVQEALTNVVRHSGARHCRIDIADETAALHLSIVDDGNGLPAAGPERRGGLLGMAERLAMVGSRLELDRAAGGGLRLTARLPLKLVQEEKGEER